MPSPDRPPVSPAKKRRIGCVGCGCLLAAVLVILVLGLLGEAGYLGFTEIATSRPADIPVYTGTRDFYLATRQKLADFNHDVKNHQAATIRLTADEINVLISRLPDVQKKNIHAFVTLTNDEAWLQASLPTDGLMNGMFKGRYLNFNASFGVTFNPETKSINLDFRNIQLGNKPPGSSQDAAQPAMNKSVMKSFSPTLNKYFNDVLRKSPDAKELLDQTKRIEITDGVVVIETQ